jgi:FkbM family methyltransferase
MPSWRARLVGGICRRYPLLSGCARVANSRLVHALAGNTTGEVWARVSGGEVLASLDDFVGRAAYFAGELDRKISLLCRRLVRPGDTVIDVGANIGMVTLLLSELVGPRGVVHAFEPNPRVLASLRATVARNASANVVVHGVALGEHDDTLHMHVPNGNAGMGSLVRAQSGDLLRGEGIGRIRLLKIDVEGFERQVLAGAVEAFAASPPDAILFEDNAHGTRTASDIAPCRQLVALGYDVFEICRSLLRLRLVRLTLGSAEPVAGHDFLALHRSVEHAPLRARLGIPSRP